MFNLNQEVKRLQQLKHAKIHGLPCKKKEYNPKVDHIDSIPFEMGAEQENTYITRRFRNHSADFGRRLSKRRGQYHRPGGGFAGHSIKGE